MIHYEDEAFIFIGESKRDSFILNNDKDLTVRKLENGEGFETLVRPQAENIFSSEQAKELETNILSKPFIRKVRTWVGVDWRRDDEYEDLDTEIKFEKIKVNLEISFFKICGYK